jgi:hypothetical protein
MTKLTDRKLSELLNNLAINYKNNPNDIYNFVYYSMQPGGVYFDLDRKEQEKVWQVLDIFLDAISKSGRQVKRSDTINITQGYKWNDALFSPRSSYHSNSFIYIDTCNSSSSFYHHGHHSGGCFGGSSSGSGGDDCIVVLVIVLIAIIAAIASAAALYLARQAYNDLDRIWYNEGRFQAVVSLALMAGTAVAVGMLMDFVLTGVFASFLLGVGFSNPVGLAIFTVFCITGIVTAFLNPLGQALQGKATELLNSQALDPREPSRFTLTDSEAARLIEKDIDPLRVKCAIVALHASLEGKETNAYKQYSFFEERSLEAQDVLTKIRQLRAGEIDTVKVRGLDFNCKKADYIAAVVSLVEPVWAEATIISEPSARQ